MTNICKSNGSVVGMQVSVSYTKIKDRKTTRVTIHKCSTNQSASLMKHHWRDIVLIRDITHVCYASNRSLPHRICKERKKARGTKAKNVAAQHFPHCLFMNYSSTEPPTPHHFGRNSSQIGTYLWIGSCQREIPLTVKKGKKRNPTECVLIHHSKAIGFKTEAVRL